jgi:hypothetical protein
MKPSISFNHGFAVVFCGFIFLWNRHVKLIVWKRPGAAIWARSNGQWRKV